jgi:DNA-binding IclR family transcriptional regulator
LDRAFRLLAAFGPADRSMSLTAMSVRADIPKSSALRIARQLVECGALERLGDAEFVIGLRLLEIASLAPRGHGLRQTALPFMEDLHVATRQHVLLAVRDGAEAVLVERLSARSAGKVLYRVGGRMPLHATGVGLCLLANAPPDVQDQVLAGDLTLVPEKRRLSASELRASLAEVRRAGVAVASRPVPSAMTSVAAPILGRGNEVIAALSVVTPSADVDPVALIPAVTAVGRSISRAMQQD